MATNPEAPEAKLKRIPFSSAEERQILALSRALNIAAAIVLLVGALGPLPYVGRLVFAATHTTGAVIAGTIGIAVVTLQLTLGVWLLQAGMLFREVALRDSDDQVFLIVALARVRRVLLVKSVVLLVLGGAFATVGLGATRALLGDG